MSHETRLARLEQEIGRKTGVVTNIAADFLYGGAPSFARVFDRHGSKLTTIERLIDEPWAAFRARVRDERPATPRMRPPRLSAVFPKRLSTPALPTDFCRQSRPSMRSSCQKQRCIHRRRWRSSLFATIVESRWCAGEDGAKAQS